MVTDWSKLQPFYVGVPHQRQPFVVSATDAEKETPPGPNDQYFEGDQDLYAVAEIHTQADAEVLMDPHDPNMPGGQIRHQALAIAMLVREELESQGVLGPDDEDD